MNPVLAARVESVREQLLAASREVRALAAAVNMFDPDTLTPADEAGVQGLLDSLVLVQRALRRTEEPLDTAVWYAHRLP